MRFVGYMIRPHAELPRMRADDQLYLELANGIFGTSLVWPETTFKEVHSLWRRLLFRALLPRDELLEVWDER